MKENEEKEMLHLREILGKLQSVQMSLYGNDKVTMEISLSGYRYGIFVSVFIGVDMGSPDAARRLVTFRLNVWNKSRHNDNICNGIIRLVQKHSV